jgi:hypothetical protein
MIFKSLTVNSVNSAESSGYFTPGVSLLQWRVPVEVEPLSWENVLFHRADDPAQKENLWESEPQQRYRMLEVMQDLLAEEGTPEEQYSRLGIDMK